MTKWEFVEDQILTNSINAAFQRAKVYDNQTASTDPNRTLLRAKLAELLSDLAKQYTNVITEDSHKNNIGKIADDLTAAFQGKELLQKGRFRIGIAQKALNLYLKYLWCLDKIPAPPHCPFDFGIIGALALQKGS